MSVVKEVRETSLRIAQDLLTADHRASAALVRLVRQPRAARAACAVLARLGDGLLWVAIALAVLAFGTPTQKAALGPLVGAVLCTTVGVAVIKLTLRRARPLGAASARWSALPKYDIHSFPSGHAARLACISVGVAVYAPLAGLAGMLLTILVSLARVALGVHYLLDVLVGGLWGSIIAALILVR